MEETFCDLRLKEVINQVDGKRLGRIIDIVINVDCGRINGIIVPGEHCKSMFKRSEDLYISWERICKIGEDVILVRLGDRDNDCNCNCGCKSDNMCGSCREDDQCCNN